MKTPLLITDPDDRGTSRQTVNLAVVHSMAERLEHEGRLYEASASEN